MIMKGKFIPINPKKYKGDPTNIIYRSSWERRCMIYFDRTPNIVEWQSEEFFIPYKSPVDGKIHRYFPDFKIKVMNKHKNIDSIIIEVKPFKQTQPPVIQTRKTKRYLTEVTTFLKNEAKWKAALNFCKDRKWKFQIITEKELGIKS